MITVISYNIFRGKWNEVITSLFYSTNNDIQEENKNYYTLCKVYYMYCNYYSSKNEI